LRRTFRARQARSTPSSRRRSAYRGIKTETEFSTAAAAFADLAEDYGGALDQLVADLGHDGSDALEAFNWILRRALHRVEEALNGR
jgi:hypothetical protein